MSYACRYTKTCRSYCTVFIGLFPAILWVGKTGQKRKPGCEKVHRLYHSSFRSSTYVLLSLFVTDSYVYIDQLCLGISILVATPGRLLDHLKHTSSFVYTNLRWIVFDEADRFCLQSSTENLALFLFLHCFIFYNRILELGFGKEIEEILDILGSRPHTSESKDGEFVRQNLLLSATLNEKVNHLANISLDNPVMIGLDDTKIKTSNKQVTLLDNAIETLQNSGKASTNAEYKLPAQLNQRYVKGRKRRHKFHA